MRPPGLRQGLDERERAARPRARRELLERPDRRHRRLAAGVAGPSRPHPPAARGRDGRVEARLAGRLAADEREVALPRLTPIEGEVHRSVRVRRPREHEHAGRAAVEPVHDPQLPVDGLELLAQAQLVPATPGDDDAPRRLVHGEQRRVGVEDPGRPCAAAHAIFLAGTTETGPKRSSAGAMAFAGPTATTTRRSSGK